MGIRGPKPVPLEILKIRNSRRAENNKTAPIPSQRKPRLPAWLDDDAKKCWRNVASQLRMMGVLTRVDENALARYCQLWARWKRAELFIQKYGNTYPLKDNEGAVKCFQQFPEVAIAHRLALALTKMEAEFGMTPSSRSRIHVDVQPQASSLQEFLQA